MTIQKILKPFVYCLIATLSLNLIIYFIVNALGIINNDGSQKNSNSLEITTVILYNSIVPVVASTIVLWVLYKLLNDPLLVFKILGGVALLFPVIMIIIQPDSSVGFKIISVLMILVPAGAVGYFLLGLFEKTTAVKAL